jgi:hypothetical protein
MRVFTPNIPRKLIALLNEAGSEREVARRRDVNMFYVSQLLNKGIEPTDRTFKGREARAALFLPRWKRREQDPKPEAPEWLKVRKSAIRAMVKATKKALSYE